jgi:hypothetical protein
MFELRKEGMKAVDEEESKIKFLKPSR